MCGLDSRIYGIKFLTGCTQLASGLRVCTQYLETNDGMVQEAGNDPLFILFQLLSIHISYAFCSAIYEKKTRLKERG
jgi:hypothetical protein